jgi:hypothetical protein
VMHEEHGGGVSALQLAQVGEQRGNFAAGVLIDAMQAYERIKDEQSRPQGLDRALQTLAIVLEIEPQCRYGDHLHIEGRQIAAGRGADAAESLAHDRLGVLGSIQEHATGLRHCEAPQGGPARGDRDGQVQGEEGFAALGLAADDADRALAPQVRDEPALFVGLRGQAVRGLDR